MTTAVRSPLRTTGEVISAATFEGIVRQHQRYVYRVLYLLVRDGDVADSLTQECFLRAYNNWPRFRGECAVRTWLLRIATNLARDHGKNRKVAFWKRLVGLDDEIGDSAPQAASSHPSPERTLLARERLQAVWKAVDSLSEQQRTVFLLRFVEEMDLDEVAGVLGLKVGTVKAHLFRATGKVREILKENQWT